MEFYYNGYKCTQRTDNSKIIISDDNNIINKIDNVNDLSENIKKEYYNVKEMIQNPDKFFTTSINSNGIEIIDIKYSVHNLIIPKSIRDKNILAININEEKLKDIEYVNYSNIELQNFNANIFRYSKNLKKIELGKYTKIKDGAFINKKKLEEVVLSDSIDTIPSNCFFGCERLKKINLDNIKKIKHSAFAKCTLLDIKLPDGLEELGFRAFYKSGIKNVLIPKTTEIIEDYVFSGCKNLQTLYSLSPIKLPDNIIKDSILDTNKDYDMLI